MADTLQSIDPTSPRGRLLRRRSQQLDERSYYISHWMDLNRFILPRSARFFSTQKNRSNLVNSSINDSTATLSLRALSAGLMSGVTNPSRPWFKFQAVNADLNAKHVVQIYLDTVRERVANVFLKSNLYTTLPTVYSDLGCYGTSAFEIMEDPTSTIRCYSWPIGSYPLGLNERLEVDTAFREAQMTVHQIVEKFGLENCSVMVQNSFKNHNIDQNYTVLHSITPNDE